MGNFFKDIIDKGGDILTDVVKYNPFTLPFALYEDQRKSASHKMGDIANQMSAAMASMPKRSQTANYSIIAALLQSKKAAASRKAQGIFTSPLGLGNISGSNAGKKMLLGQ